MFLQKRKNTQIVLKSQLSAREHWKCKILLQIRKSAEKVLRAIGAGSHIYRYPELGRDVWSRDF